MRSPGRQLPFRPPMLAAILLSMFSADAAFAARQDVVVRTDPARCVQDTYRQPQGRYALHVFCDAQPPRTTIGLVRLAPVGQDAWAPLTRFWQEAPWSLGVGAFAWDTKADVLYVVVDPRGEDGGIYRLDLAARTFAKFFSLDDVATSLLDWHREHSDVVGHELAIEAADLNAGSLKFAVRLRKASGEWLTVAKKTARFGAPP